MEWIASIQQAISYIEDHLLEEINYADAARSVYISEYEFHRAFRFLTGMTANTYIRNRRLSLAGKEILETSTRISDIALKYGFDTPESFTKAFIRFHGIAPRHARETSAKLILFSPIVIKLNVAGGKIMNYKIIQTKEQKFLAFVKAFPTAIINEEANRDIADFWDACHTQNLIDPIRSLRPAGKQDLYGLCSPTQNGSSTFDYGIGILIDEDTLEFDTGKMEQAGYHIWKVQPETYAVFDCIGEDGNCISDTWSKFYKEFLPQMGYEASQETDYEVYFDRARPNLFCELWIPVKKQHA